MLSIVFVLCVSEEAKSAIDKHVPVVPRLYVIAAKQNKVAPVLIYSIAMVESLHGKGVRHPWPWTVNDRGKGLWFSTKEEAIAYCKNLISQGVDQFDVGLMQLNWRWHKSRFTSIENAFTPMNNLKAGAGFLKELYDETHSMEVAVGYYHNRKNTIRAEWYRNKVRRKMKLVLSGRV